MKHILVALFALLFMGVSMNAAVYANTASSVVCSGDDQVSTMKISVKKVVKNEKKAEALKQYLMSVKGVKNVDMCLHSGTVTISYSKPEMGCCSALHSAMKDGGWKYELVSNEEKPACASGQKSCTPGVKTADSGKACPSGGNAKACAADGKSCAGGANGKACCKSGATNTSDTGKACCKDGAKSCQGKDKKDKGA